MSATTQATVDYAETDTEITVRRATGLAVKCEVLEQRTPGEWVYYTTYSDDRVRMISTTDPVAPERVWELACAWKTEAGLNPVRTTRREPSEHFGENWEVTWTDWTHTDAEGFESCFTEDEHRTYFIYSRYDGDPTAWHLVLERAGWALYQPGRGEPDYLEPEEAAAQVAAWKEAVGL